MKCIACVKCIACGAPADERLCPECRAEVDERARGKQSGIQVAKKMTPENAAFGAMARTALPYWIQRAEKMERALERACKHIFCCPPEGACAAGLGVKCAACWKKYFLEGAE